MNTRFNAQRPTPNAQRPSSKTRDLSPAAATDSQTSNVARRILGRWALGVGRRALNSAIIALVLCAFAFPAAADKQGVVQCANVIYAGNKTSKCFADAFLTMLQQKTTIVTERRFKPVKLDSSELFDFPFIVMTGEGDFRLLTAERENLAKHLQGGGFLLASAGCSSKEWDDAFRRELKAMSAGFELKPIPLTHPLFRTVFQIEKLDLAKSSGTASLEGIEVNGRLVCVYSRHGLNDTHNATGCCCCGGNEIRNSLEVNVNIVAYALLH